MAKTYRSNKNVITIGTATAYLMEWDKGTLPAIDTICVEGNRFGYTKGGATIEYSQTNNEEQDDLGLIKKTILSEESATIKLGVFGWNGDVIKQIVSTASVTTDDGKRVTEIGGVANDDGKRYVICLHHEDALDGDCWWMGVGKNTEGLELAYAQDSGTALEPTFTCEPYDDSGRLLKFVEVIAGETGTTGTTGSTGVTG